MLALVQAKSAAAKVQSAVGDSAGLFDFGKGNAQEVHTDTQTCLRVAKAAKHADDFCSAEEWFLVRVVLFAQMPLIMLSCWLYYLVNMQSTVQRESQHAACLQAGSKAKSAAKDVQNKAGNPLQAASKVCFTPLDCKSNSMGAFFGVCVGAQNLLQGPFVPSVSLCACNVQLVVCEGEHLGGREMPLAGQGLPDVPWYKKSRSASFQALFCCGGADQGQPG